MVNPVILNQFSTDSKKYLRAAHQHSQRVCEYIKGFKHIALNRLSDVPFGYYLCLWSSLLLCLALLQIVNGTPPCSAHSIYYNLLD